MSTVYLIRHGMTEANRQHLYCGSTDLSLSKEGISGLQNLKYDISGCVFLTSGMCRTEQTLFHLFGDVPHRVDPRFREMDFGIFEMGSYQSLKDTPAYQAWLSGDNEANIAPNGESGNAMQARVLAAFREITEDTVIITHGGPIAAIMAFLFPKEGKNRYEWQPKPGHGYKITEFGYSPIPERGNE